MGPNEPVSYDHPTSANGGESVSGHPGAGPSGETDPVLVSLLRNRIRFTPEVVAQAVIELERAGRLRIETEGAPGGGAARLLAPVDTEAGAFDAAFEPDGAHTAGPAWSGLVLRRLGARELPAAPTPLSLLTTVDGGDFWDWRHAFEQDLLARAQRAGLVERRLAPRQTAAVVCLVTLLAAAAVGCLVAVFFRPSPGFGAALATALFGFILFSALLGRLADWRQTEAGRRTAQAAEQGQAAADPAARARQEAIRAAVAPLSKNHVWSSHGGGWRVVGLGSRFGDTKRLPRQVREALPDRRVLACQVVKRWAVPGGRERDPAYCCAFDDGASSFTWSFAMPERTWAALAVGQVVLVDFSPRRHRLYDVRPLQGGEL
jgi:hypothetical protein